MRKCYDYSKVRLEEFVEVFRSGGKRAAMEKYGMTEGQAKGYAKKNGLHVDREAHHRRLRAHLASPEFVAAMDAGRRRYNEQERRRAKFGLPTKSGKMMQRSCMAEWTRAYRSIWHACKEYGYIMLNTDQGHVDTLNVGYDGNTRRRERTEKILFNNYRIKFIEV